MGESFQSFEKIILVPHCASNAAEANARMAETCIANCVAIAVNQPEKPLLACWLIKAFLGLNVPSGRLRVAS